MADGSTANRQTPVNPVPFAAPTLILVFKRRSCGYGSNGSRVPIFRGYAYRKTKHDVLPVVTVFQPTHISLLLPLSVLRQMQ